MSVRNPAGRSFQLSSFAILIVGLLVLLSAGCRLGMPVIDPTGPDPTAPGTISGTVRTEDGVIEGRLVEVVNIDTGERQQVRTSNVGGFTFKVSPGKYRVSVALNQGESVLKAPGVMDVHKSDVDAFADFVIGISRLERPRLSEAPNPALGPPIA